MLRTFFHRTVSGRQFPPSRQGDQPKICPTGATPADIASSAGMGTQNVNIQLVDGRVATNVEISTKRGKTKIFLTNVEKTWISVISMEKPWKFEIGVKEKTWIFNFPLLRKNQPPIFVTNVEKNVVFGDFYGKIVENRTFWEKTAGFGNY